MSPYRDGLRDALRASVEKKTYIIAMVGVSGLTYTTISYCAGEIDGLETRVVVVAVLKGISTLSLSLLT